MCASCCSAAALIPPLPYLGASALVDAAIGRESRVGASAPTPSSRCRPTAAPSPGPTPSRPAAAGRRDEAAALFAEGDAALAGLPWWRRLLHTVVLECAVTDGWGDPVPTLRADLAAHEQAGDVRARPHLP